MWRYSGSKIISIDIDKQAEIFKLPIPNLSLQIGICRAL